MTAYITDFTHISEMLDIEQRSFPSPWSREDIESVIANEARNLRTVGIFDADKLCGWGSVAVLGEEAHLLTVGIAPEQRQKGCGKALTQALMQAASDAGARYMELECRRSNITAQNMYRSLGFIRVGVNPGYYTDTHEDALIYVCIVLPAPCPENDPYLINPEDE